MENREWLNTLSNDKFAIKILAKVGEFQQNNFDPELDIFDITDGTIIDFEEWLKQEHKE